MCSKSTDLRDARRVSPLMIRRLTRRAALALAGAWLGSASRRAVAAGKPTLLSAPIEIGGEWGQSMPWDAQRVVTRMREVCLGGVKLVSDRQPERLRVDDHPTGPPHIWLHSDQPETAWVVVDIGTRDWCKLAYQFGHELGHVLCNSWQWQAVSNPPCRWLEESMVEAFSIRGLAVLAASWNQNPPFPRDAAFGGAIRQYRITTMEQYRRAGGPAPGEPLAAWFRTNRDKLGKETGLGAIQGQAVLTLAAAYASDPALIADLGAANRWPERTSMPIADYLRLWRKSCAELGAPGRLPSLLAERLGVA
jgi:hypothetical protein